MRADGSSRRPRNQPTRAEPPTHREAAEAGELRFGILGPLQVRRNGHTHTPTAPRLRTLLALLVVRANLLVSYEELIEELWGAHPPANPVNALHVSVRRLRAALGCDQRPATEQPLSTCPGGYRLEAAPELLDVARFEALVARGRHAASAGDPTGAAEALRAALAMWRGPVLAGVQPGAVLHARSVALEEARLVALEERVDAELRTARHRELVAELRTLTTRYPLREAFWRQLMVALCRSGRRAEALAAYQRLRNALIRELGVEPGAELARLQQDILTGHASVQSTTGTAQRMHTPQASELPAGVADFVGRAGPLARLTDILLTRNANGGLAAPTVVISGKPGVGKTALAVHAAHLHRDAFPDGQLYADLRGTQGGRPASDVLARFLRALAREDVLIPGSAEEQARLYRSWLAGRRMLVLLDDAAGQSQVRPLVPADPRCVLVVTSRRRLCLEGATTIDLPLLELGEAVELLHRIAGPSRVAANRRAAERVTRLCGLLPLAVRAAGAKLATRPHWTLTDLEQRLAGEPDRLSELQVGDLDVRASFALSYQACDPAERRAFRLLSCVPDPDFPAPVAAAACDTDVPTATSVVERLVDAQLLQVAGRDETGRLRYRFHELLWVYAAERLAREEPHSRPGARRRVLASRRPGGRRPGASRQDRHTMTLADRLPPDADPDTLYDTFAGWTAERGLDLYPAQQEALIELVTGSNVILATPTGSGKSLVATGAVYAALARDEVSFYTAPIKALVSEKFFVLCEEFGADNVGMITGDSSVNADAPIICCTAEILANLALRDGADADVGLVVMDEFHFYGEPDRGWAWQVPLLELPQAQYLLMSATLGDVSFFERDLTRRTGRATAAVRSSQRPVPLSFRYVTTPVHETLTDLMAADGAPVYVVHFTQASALERAQALTSINVCTRAEKDMIAAEIGRFRFAAGFGKTLSRLVRHGIGVHHAGMLPRYRRLVERLTQAGLLKIICGTDTLGVGINVPIRTVLFTALSKYDGVRTRHLMAREFHQIAGRAGRAGFDTVGTVVVQAPEHVVETERALAKAGDDPKKRRKVVRKKPPEGFVSWGEPTYQRLIAADPEPLTSSFAVSHAMLLNVIGRPGDPFTAMRRLIDDNHSDRRHRLRHVRRAVAIYRALLAAGVVVRDDAGRPALADDFQVDFALNQPLSPFALAAIELLDRDSPDYPLDVLSVIEATLEDPRPIISAQRFKARGEAVAAMKAEGIEYDERMALLEDVTHPRPLADLLDEAYQMYRKGHPWVEEHQLSPKSVARDLYERAMTFTEYVSFYGVARSEGLVLRYLADAYKAVRQTVPEDAKTEELLDLEAWLGELVRQIDSSLLDEWEKLRNPGAPEPELTRDEGPPAVTRNPRAFRVLVRNALFRRVELAALRRYDDLAALDADSGWDAEAWADALEPYWDEHDDIGTGPDARGPKLLLIEQEAEVWRVRQIFDDPAGHHDWGISAEVDLAASDEAGEPVLTVTAVDQL